MIFLGIDPGSRKAGYGVVESRNRRVGYIASGVMKYDGTTQFLDRLGKIYKSCEALITRYNPDEIAIESLIYVKSVTALSKLAQARGAMIAAFMQTHEKRVFEYSPNLIKSSVTGYGHASKEAINKMLNIIFSEKLKFASNDESDALAIAICHYLQRNSKSTFRKSRISEGIL